MQLKSNYSNLRIHQSTASGINKAAIFFIPKHSCGIFTALFSRVNTKSEREDWELLLEFYMYLPPVVRQAQFASERLSLRGWQGGGSLKELCHRSAKVVKSKNSFTSMAFLQSPPRACVYLRVWIKSWILKRLFFQKGRLLWVNWWSSRSLSLRGLAYCWLLNTLCMVMLMAHV